MQGAQNVMPERDEKKKPLDSNFFLENLEQQRMWYRRCFALTWSLLHIRTTETTAKCIPGSQFLWPVLKFTAVCCALFKVYLPLFGLQLKAIPRDCTPNYCGKQTTQRMEQWSILLEIMNTYWTINQTKISGLFRFLRFKDGEDLLCCLGVCGGHQDCTFWV